MAVQLILPPSTGDGGGGGVTPFDEVAVRAAYLALSPVLYSPLTGSSPLDQLGSAASTLTAASGCGRAPAAEFDRPPVSPVNGGDLSWSSLSTGSAMSWAAWVNWEVIGTANASLTLLAKGTNGDNFGNRNFQWFIDPATGFLGLRRFSGSDATIGSSTSVVPQGQWVHVATTYASGSMIHYVNGVPDTTITSVTGGLNTTSRAVYVGGLSGSVFSTFRGLFCHCATWHSVLTPTEVADLAAAGVPA